jgi:hypothetical protein
VLTAVLLSLAHITTSEWILAGFVAACGLLAALPELLPGRKRDEDEPPDTGEDGRDDVLLAA